MMTPPFLSPLLLLILSLLSVSAALNISEAAEVLHNSGYKSMALSLEMGADSLGSNPDLTSVTILAPSEAAFSAAKQPTLQHLHLRLHLLPYTLSLPLLKQMPLGVQLPTLLRGQYLNLSGADDGGITLNNVAIDPRPIYAGGSSFTVFVIHELFSLHGFKMQYDMYFSFQGVASSTPNPNGDDAVGNEPSSNANGKDAVAEEGTSVLKAKGAAIMAGVFKVQLLSKQTIFAPLDKVIRIKIDTDQYTSFLCSHIVPDKRLTYSDLVSLKEGSVLMTKQDGFTITVTGRIPKVNGVSLILPEMYKNEWVVVHGIGAVLSPSQNTSHGRSTYRARGGWGRFTLPASDDVQHTLVGNSSWVHLLSSHDFPNSSYSDTTIIQPEPWTWGYVRATVFDLSMMALNALKPPPPLPGCPQCDSLFLGILRGSLGTWLERVAMSMFFSCFGIWIGNGNNGGQHNGRRGGGGSDGPGDGPGGGGNDDPEEGGGNGDAKKGGAGNGAAGGGNDDHEEGGGNGDAKKGGAGNGAAGGGNDDPEEGGGNGDAKKGGAGNGAEKQVNTQKNYSNKRKRGNEVVYI